MGRRGIMAYMTNKALIIIDVQNDFMSYGNLPVDNAERVIPIINELQQHYENIIITQDWHPPDHSSFCSQHKLPAYTVIDMPYGKQTLWPDHCVAYSYGADLAVKLKSHQAHLIIRKGYHQDIDSYSAFYENDHITPTGLHGYLQERNITELVFVGVAYDFCVAWSAKDAAKLGYTVSVIKDACAAIDLNGSVDVETASMKELGISII
jgi:nicotinamidase/pyrazinamidase